MLCDLTVFPKSLSKKHVFFFSIWKACVSSDKGGASAASTLITLAALKARRHFLFIFLVFCSFIRPEVLSQLKLDMCVFRSLLYSSFMPFYVRKRFYREGDKMDEPFVRVSISLIHRISQSSQKLIKTHSTPPLS